MIEKNQYHLYTDEEKFEIVKDHLDNGAKGVGQLLDVLQALDPFQTKRIGLEATGHYGYSLKVFLDRNGFDYMEFKPIFTYI